MRTGNCTSDLDWPRIGIAQERLTFDKNQFLEIKNVAVFLEIGAREIKQIKRGNRAPDALLERRRAAHVENLPNELKDGQNLLSAKDLRIAGAQSAFRPARCERHLENFVKRTEGGAKCLLRQELVRSPARLAAARRTRKADCRDTTDANPLSSLEHG